MDLDGIRLDVDVNFYPDVRTGWWFSHDSSNKRPSIIEEKIPTFHVPEIPLGTMVSLATILLIVYLKTKKLPIKF